MSKVELFVSLKIPDTTAITTFHTIEKMGFSKITKVKREIYYKFEIDGNKKKFAESIGKVDVLVNANKNRYSNKLSKERGATYIMVKEIDDKCDGLLNTLKNRLGFSEIKSIEKGVIWVLYGDRDSAIEAAKRLLFNENYQRCGVL